MLFFSDKVLANIYMIFSLPFKIIIAPFALFYSFLFRMIKTRVRFYSVIMNFVTNEIESIEDEVLYIDHEVGLFKTIMAFRVGEQYYISISSKEKNIDAAIAECRRAKWVLMKKHEIQYKLKMTPTETPLFFEKKTGDEIFDIDAWVEKSKIPSGDS